MYAKDNHATSGAHFNLSVGTVFLNKYQVVQVAGTGNFARVYECVNIQTKERVAVKVLKKGYERDADFECDVLRGIGRCDPNDNEGIVKLVERTTHQGLAVIVFKLKGAPLRNARLPLSESETKQVVQDVGDALSFLHFRVKAVHTDLKPENILAELQHMPSSMGGSRKWAICDLGSASFYKDGQLDRDLITTRPYRAPEVVLNRGWCFPSDTWSLGCILYELRTGKKLFDCHNDADHLRMMEDRLGVIPAAIRGVTRIPQNFASRPARTVAEEFAHEPAFLSLLMCMLEYDPTKRIRCDAIRSHPYLSSLPCTPSSVPSSSRDVRAMEHMMRGISTNDENAVATNGAKKPSNIPPVLSAPSSGAFTFGASAPNGAAPRHSEAPYSTTSNAYGSKTHMFAAPLAAAVAAAKRRSTTDPYAEGIPMTHITGYPHHNAAGSAPTSACSSANNSPSRMKVSSAQSSPRLISPAVSSRPLSYRLTYL